jgi:hypothetical protein
MLQRLAPRHPWLVSPAGTSMYRRSAGSTRLPISSKSHPALPGFAENYCRKHISVATQFLTRALATHNGSSAETKRLVRIANLIEENLKVNLD